MKKIDVIKSGNTNCYLIDTGKQNILIDAGTIIDCNFLEKLEMKIAIPKIDFVILTHGHYDHVGYASVLQKNYDIKIAMHKNDLDMVLSANMAFPNAKGFFSKLIKKQTLTQIEKATYTAFTPDIIIAENELKDYSDIQIISLPGHTPGSIGIFFDNDLFAGDLLMNMPLPSLSWFAEDFNILRESLRKVQNMRIDRVYPGHGNPFSGKWLKRIN